VWWKERKEGDSGEERKVEIKRKKEEKKIKRSIKKSSFFL